MGPSDSGDPNISKLPIQRNIRVSHSTLTNMAKTASEEKKFTSPESKYVHPAAIHTKNCFSTLSQLGQNSSSLTITASISTFNKIYSNQVLYSSSGCQHNG